MEPAIRKYKDRSHLETANSRNQIMKIHLKSVETPSKSSWESLNTTSLIGVSLHQIEPKIMPTYNH